MNDARTETTKILVVYLVSEIDLQDTWSETNGVRTLNRSAMLYGVDGTRIQAYVNDTNNDGGPDAESSGVVPLTLDELVTLVEMPQLRITAPVPPGTAPLQIDCGGWTDESSGRELDRSLGNQKSRQRTHTESHSVAGGSLPVR